MDFLRLVEEARTCRRFDEAKPLSEDDLLWLLECARRAPSARNAQELRFITINQGTVLDGLLPLVRWAGALKDWDGPPPGERPTAFVAFLMPEKTRDLLFVDLGICGQTIQLAASARGWGACMIQAFDHGKASELLQIPAGMKLSLLMALGVAVEKRVIAPMPEDGSCAYWRDSKGVHNVPKRSMAELVAKKV